MGRFAMEIGGFLAAAQLLIGCTQSSTQYNYSESIRYEECSSKEGFVEAQYDFSEPWMDDYSVWVKHAEAEITSFGIGGKNFSPPTDNLATVQIYDESTRCILEIEAASFQISSLRLFMTTFGPGGFLPFDLEQIGNLTSSTSSEVRDAAMHISASVIADGGAMISVRFLVINGDIFAL